MARKTDPIDALKNVPLLSELSKAELRAVRKAAKEEMFAAGDVIVREGDTGGRFYLILRGRAVVTLRGRKRATLGPGDSFGEMTILDGVERSSTVRAETDMETLSLASWDFLALLQEQWSITKKVLAQLSGRVRALERSPIH